MAEQREATGLGGIAAPGEVIAGKYRIDRQLGHGGMGVVVQAWHLGLDERVAIKFLRPTEGLRNDEAMRRFEREARAAFKIKSEHACRVIDVGKLPDGSPFLVMEFLEGRELAELLTDRRGMPIARAVDLVLQACDALMEAHVRGIVHRDLKPENMFITEAADGSPKLKILDFGLSKIAEAHLDKDGPRERALTTQDRVLGTPNYMPPEQWVSARDVGPESDQWALAAILYELIAGSPPFEGDGLGQVCARILNQPTPPLCARVPECPPALEQALMRALSKDPLDRFANVAELAIAIAPFGTSAGRATAERVRGVLARAQQGEITMPGGVRARDVLPAAALVTQSSGVGPRGPTQPIMTASMQLEITPPGLRRPQTAQSWQQSLGESARPRSRTALFVAGGVTLLLAAVATVAFVVGHDEPSKPAASAIAETAPSIETEPPAPTVLLAPAAAAPSATVSAKPSAAPSASTVYVPPPPFRPMRPRPAPPPERPPQGNPRRPEIFNRP